MSDDRETGPTDPFEELRETSVRLLETQHVRYAMLTEMADTATADHGDMLGAIRTTLDRLDAPRPAPSATVNAALLRAAEYCTTAYDDGERREAVRLYRDALDPPELVPQAVSVRKVAGDPPIPVLSKARPDGQGRPVRHGAVLSVGTVAVLAGAGGAAKTTLALQIALRSAETLDGVDCEACGGALVVRGGPALLAAFEDSLPVLRDKALRMPVGSKRGLDRLHLIDLAGWPLYSPPAGRGAGDMPVPAEGWSALWAAVDATGARLVVVDPALAAFTGGEQRGGPSACVPERVVDRGRQARRGRAADRPTPPRPARRGEGGKQPDLYDAGQIGGSSHWTDGARGALSLSRDSDDPDRHHLAIVKANYGPAFVSIDLLATRAPFATGTVGGAVIGLDATAAGWHGPNETSNGTPDAQPADNGAAHRNGHRRRTGRKVDTEGMEA